MTDSILKELMTRMKSKQEIHLAYTRKARREDPDGRAEYNGEIGGYGCAMSDLRQIIAQLEADPRDGELP